MNFIKTFLLSTFSLVVATCFYPHPAWAVIGGETTRDSSGVRRFTVAIESSRGELCSGVLVQKDVVLTAAHCVVRNARYRVTGQDTGFKPVSFQAVSLTLHPEFIPGTTPRTQPGIDLALVKLASSFSDDFTPLDPWQASAIKEGDKLTLAGFGLLQEGRASTARILRHAELLSIGSLEVANKVQVLVDPDNKGETLGFGACRGDSGGPVLRSGFAGMQLAGIVSWSSGPLHGRVGRACGGLTAVTPVADHARWIAARTEDMRLIASGFRATTEPVVPALPTDLFENRQ